MEHIIFKKIIYATIEPQDIEIVDKNMREKLEGLYNENNNSLPMIIKVRGLKGE